MNIIELKAICKSYNTVSVETVVLKKVNLNIKEGEFVAIMGPSGSGKSTLMNIIGFLDVPNCGEYIFDGKKVVNFNENSLADIRNKKLGFVFQSYFLLPRMTALENVKLPMIYAHISEKEQKLKAEKLLTRVGLETKFNSKPNQLSGGEQQRVAIARALANEPKVILADEPTGNLDTKASGEIMKIFTDIHASGRTIIMVTHDNNIASYADRTIHIKDGEIASVKNSTSKRK